MTKHSYTFKGKEIANLFSNGFIFDETGLPIHTHFDESVRRMFPQYRIITRRNYKDSIVTSITIGFESEEEMVLFLMKCPYRYVWSDYD